MKELILGNTAQSLCARCVVRFFVRLYRNFAGGLCAVSPLLIMRSTVTGMTSAVILDAALIFTAVQLALGAAEKLSGSKTH